MAEKATILVVDDSEDVLNLVAATLGKEHHVRRAQDGAAALHAAFEEPQPDLILLDVEMPDVSGFQICSTLKAAPQVADIPVIFLTGNADPRAVIEGFKLGAIDYLVKPVSPRVLAVRVQTHLELIKHRLRSDELLAERTVQLERTRLELIRRLGRAMEYHETSAVGNRVVRLGHYARALAEAAGARPTLCDLIMKAAPLHDIGKVGVPASVLRKGGALTAPEREQMQRHPEIGAEIIGEHEDPLLKLARTLALTHHERWDGNGYPTGAKGADIPWAGRLMAIVDSFESMTATQFHREPRPIELAADEIYRGSGKQFDPQLVEAFRRAMPWFREIHATYGDQLGDLLNLDFSAAVPEGGPAQQQADSTSEMKAMQAMRDADAERAQALAGAQQRLQVERELAAAAQSDIVTRQAAVRKFEERAAREAELLAAAKTRIAEENDAARLLRDQEEAETKAQEAAKQARLAELQAISAAHERERAAEALASLKEAREVSGQELEAARRERAEAEARASEAEAKAQGAVQQAQRAKALEQENSRKLEAAIAQRQQEAKAARAAQETAAAEKSAAELQRKAEAEAKAVQSATEQRLAAEQARAEAEAQRREAQEKAAQEARAAAAAEAKLAALARQAAHDAEQASAAAQEQLRAEEALAKAAREKTEAEQRAAEFARKVESEARAAEAAARNRISQETLQIEAATQRQAAEEAAAQAARAASEAEAKVTELAKQAERTALKAEAAAKEKLLQEQKLADAAADKLRAKQSVAGATARKGEAEKAAAQYREAKARDEAAAAAITIVAAQRRSRSKGLLLGFLLGLGAAAAAGWYAMEQELLPALVVQNTPIAPPAPPQKPAPEPRPIFGDGEAVALRLDSAFEKIPAR